MSSTILVLVAAQDRSGIKGAKREDINTRHSGDGDLPSHAELFCWEKRNLW